MIDLMLIAVAAATVNNFVLVRLLGLCPVLGTSARLDEALGLSLATTGVLTVTAGLSYLLDRWVLEPYGLPYLRIIGFLALTALTVHAANALVSRRLHRAGIRNLPLIATNCAVLGVALISVSTVHSLAGALALGLGAGLGYGLVLLLFASLRPRLAQIPVPAALRGPAIDLLTAGMMSLAFVGFTGFGN